MNPIIVPMRLKNAKNANDLKIWRSTETIPPNSTSPAIIDRRNGQVVSSVPFPDDQNPDLLPDPSTVIWHYLPFEYFKALLNNRAFWFTRLDKQKDKTDGTYTQANASEMTGPVKALLVNFGVKEPDREGQTRTNQILRKQTYVHCWSMRPHESAWMWHSFLNGETRSVVLRSTIGQVHYALSGQPVELKRILYCPTRIPRPDHSYTAPFAAKDKLKYEEEREVRLIMTMGLGASEDVEHKLAPVNLKKLIGKVIVNPLSPSEFRDEVQFELEKHSIDAAVSRSWLRRSHLEAVAKSIPHKTENS